MNVAILLQCEDWEGLYINDKLVKEGHTLNEGTNRIKYFVKLAEVHNFDLNTLQIGYLNPENEEWINDIGSFPEDIRDFNSGYIF